MTSSKAAANRNVLRFALTDAVGVLFFVLALIAWDQGMSPLAWLPAGALGVGLMAYAVITFLKNQPGRAGSKP